MTNQSANAIAWTQNTVDELLNAEPYLLEYEASATGGIWWQNHSEAIRKMTLGLNQKDIDDIKWWQAKRCKDAYVRYALGFFETLFSESK